MLAWDVFLDETAVKTNLTRQHSRAAAYDGGPFRSWGTQRLIAGLMSDVLIVAWIIKGGINGEAFATYTVKC